MKASLDATSDTYELPVSSTTDWHFRPKNRCKMYKSLSRILRTSTPENNNVRMDLQKKGWVRDLPDHCSFEKAFVM
jgi:hypothetical protein